MAHNSILGYDNLIPPSVLTAHFIWQSLMRYTAVLCGAVMLDESGIIQIRGHGI